MMFTDDTSQFFQSLFDFLSSGAAQHDVICKQCAPGGGDLLCVGSSRLLSGAISTK